MRALALAAVLVAAPALADEAADIAGCLDTTSAQAQAEACTRLVKAGTLPPERMARVHNNLGHAKLELGDTEGAVKEFETALSLSPGFFLAQHNLGVALAQAGELGAAAAAYGRALEMVPDPANTDLTRAASHRNRAEVRLALENWDGVIEDVAAALAESDGISDPVSGWKTEMYLWRGIALSRLGRSDEAIADFNAHIGLWPEDPQVLLERGHAFSDLGLHSAARGDLEAYNADEPDDPVGLFQLAYTIGELGEIEREVELLTRAIEVGGTDPTIWNNRAFALCAIGRGAEAEADWLSYWEKAPNAALQERDWLIEAGYYTAPADGEVLPEAMKAALAAYVAVECRAP